MSYIQSDNQEPNYFINKQGEALRPSDGKVISSSLISPTNGIENALQANDINSQTFSAAHDLARKPEIKGTALTIDIHDLDKNGSHQVSLLRDHPQSSTHVHRALSDSLHHDQMQEQLSSVRTVIKQSAAADQNISRKSNELPPRQKLIMNAKAAHNTAQFSKAGKNAVEPIAKGRNGCRT